MRIGITGTPGVGKTTAADELPLDRDVIHLNQVLREHEFTQGWDDDRGTAIADLTALEDWLAAQSPELIVESHLAHRLGVDRVVVLRCDPGVLRERLADRSDTGEDGKIAENVESERMDVILVEAVERHSRDSVAEIDTTDQTPTETATAIAETIARFEADEANGDSA